MLNSWIETALATPRGKMRVSNKGFIPPRVAVEYGFQPVRHIFQCLLIFSQPMQIAVHLDTVNLRVEVEHTHTHMYANVQDAGFFERRWYTSRITTLLSEPRGVITRTRTAFGPLDQFPWTTHTHTYTHQRPWCVSHSNIFFRTMTLPHRSCPNLRLRQADGHAMGLQYTFQKTEYMHNEPSETCRTSEP